MFDFEENRLIEKTDIEKNIQQDFMTDLRVGFIRKVYGILSCQLLITTLMCIISMTSSSFFAFQINNMWLLFLSIFIVIALPCAALCYSNLLRKTPDNYIFLGLFTLFESYLVSFVCGASNPKLVFMAACMTCAMCIGLTLYAITTKTDVTLYGGSLFIIGTALLMFSLFAMFTDNKIVHILLSSLWTIIFGIYIVYDTQLIIGNQENSISMDDYILASLMLYLDIINLFLNLLKLLSLLSGSKEN